VVNRPAAEAGLSLLEAGGDFADGVIAYEGRWLGADTFVSFDKKAVKLTEAKRVRTSAAVDVMMRCVFLALDQPHHRARERFRFFLRQIMACARYDAMAAAAGEL